MREEPKPPHRTCLVCCEKCDDAGWFVGDNVVCKECVKALVPQERDLSQVYRNTKPIGNPRMSLLWTALFCLLILAAAVVYVISKGDWSIY